MKGKLRNSNIELLRIISMIMIIVHHYAMFTDINTSFFSNTLIKYGLLSFGKIGVNIFVIISGYYLVTSNFSFRKFFKLLMEIVFFSIFGIFIYILLFNRSLPLSELFINCTPIVHQLNWFVTTYIILYLLSSFINILLNNINKRQHQLLILLLFVIWSVLPTLFNIYISYTDLGWFIFLYILAAYFRLYQDKYNLSVKMNVISILIVSIFYFSWITYGVIKTYAYQDILKYADMCKIPCILLSVNLFLIFKNVNIKYNKIINNIAKHTFAICLLHENNLLYPIYWKEFFSNNNLYFYQLIFQCIYVIIIIYVVCIIVDVIRIHLFENIVLNLYDKINESSFSKKIRMIIKEKLTNYNEPSVQQQ